MDHLFEVTDDESSRVDSCCFDLQAMAQIYKPRIIATLLDQSTQALQNITQYP
jgi:hypothetical protein